MKAIDLDNALSIIGLVGGVTYVNAPKFVVSKLKKSLMWLGFTL